MIRRSCSYNALDSEASQRGRVTLKFGRDVRFHDWEVVR